MGNKKGIIKITDVLIKECWEGIYIIFKDFRPTQIEFRHWENDVWYFYGVSELFDELKEGESVPFYDVEFNKFCDENAIFKTTYEFNRV